MEGPLIAHPRWQPVVDLLNERRYEDATALLIDAARAGDADAQLLLAQRWYQDEEDVEPVTWDETLSWLEAAASSGHPDAMWRLAALRPDRPLDRDLLVRAAEAGSLNAQRTLAGNLVYGDAGFPTDPVRGAAWFRRAAESGDVFSMDFYGNLLAMGLGVPRDEAAALTWWERAASAEPQDGEGTQAAYALDAAYREGQPGVMPDPERADFWCHRACELRERPLRLRIFLPGLPTGG